MEQREIAPERVTIVLHSGDMDKLYSALIIANGALAMGMEASFTLHFGPSNGCAGAGWRRDRSPG